MRPTDDLALARLVRHMLDNPPLTRNVWRETGLVAALREVRETQPRALRVFGAAVLDGAARPATDGCRWCHVRARTTVRATAANHELLGTPCGACTRLLRTDLRRRVGTQRPRGVAGVISRGTGSSPTATASRASTPHPTASGCVVCRSLTASGQPVPPHRRTPAVTGYVRLAQSDAERRNAVNAAYTVLDNEWRRERRRERELERRRGRGSSL